MPTIKTRNVTVQNLTNSYMDIFVAHRADSSVPLRLQTGTIIYGVERPTPVEQYQYPVSTAYYRTSVDPQDGLQFDLDYEAGPGAGMDYWYVAVNMTTVGSVGAYSVGGSALFPNYALKIPEPPGTINIAVGPPLPGQTAPTFSVDSQGDGQVSGMGPMNADKAFSPWPLKRKNIAALTPDERAAYVQAVKGLKNAPSQMSPATHSRYDDYVLVHMLSMNQITPGGTPVQNSNITIGAEMRSPMWAHQGPQFLAWHREFLRQFELDLQGQLRQNPATTAQIGYLFGIPYWDWSVNSGPGEVPWLDDFMGPNGQGGNGPVLTQCHGV